MPRIKLSDEVKAAIKALSDKDKTKLLYRLIPSNDILVEQLTFELLEFGETTEERRNDVLNTIKETGGKYTNRYYSPLTLLRVMRKLSSMITRHVRVTKDKVGEVELNLVMMETLLVPNESNLESESMFELSKLAKYFIGRMHKVEKLLGKLHEDYYLEFEDQILRLNKLIQKNDVFGIEAANQGYEVS